MGDGALIPQVDVLPLREHVRDFGDAEAAMRLEQVPQNRDV
jgi:hypothetical protein